jgi:hypothetical protein
VALDASVVEKLRATWVRQTPPRSFDSAPQAVRYAIDPHGASLRMTALWRGVNNLRLAAQKTRKDRKSHETAYCDFIYCAIRGGMVECWRVELIAVVLFRRLLSRCGWAARM